MSSLVRRIQKRIARSQGFHRNRDGLIVNTDGDSVGRRWPQVAAPTNKFELERRANDILRRLDRHGVKA